MNKQQSLFQKGLSEAAQYPRTRDWILRIYDYVLNRFKGMPLPFRKKVFSIQRKGISDPIALRIGSSDWKVLNEMFKGGEYDTLFQYDLGDVRWIVDLGSNVGLSLILWRQHFPEARVLAVEPDEDNVRILRLNVADGLKKQTVTVVQACVLGRSRPVQLEREGHGAWAYVVKDAGSGGETIPAFTMTDLMQAHCPGATIDLLKCDIEGSESELFQNCGDWLHKVRFVAIELHKTYGLKELERDTTASGVPIDILWSSKTDDGMDVTLVIFKVRLPVSDDHAAEAKELSTPL